MRIYLFTIILLFLYLGCYSQDPAKTEKNVYQSDQKLYINKDLGIYLWISTSPDPDSEKYRLHSDSSVKFTNPMFLDTEGFNSIRSPYAVDTNTKQIIYPLQDIVFEVYADGLPPVSRINIDAENTRTIEGKNYFGGKTEITIHSTDAVSGVTSIFYSLNGEGFKEYKNPLNTIKEGENTLKYYAVDKVGNTETVNEKTFILDNTPPKTEYEIVGLLNDNYVAPDAVIKLKSTDNLSGIKSVYYKVGEGKYQKYVAPIPVSAIKKESDQICFYAEDNLGNKEKEIQIGGKSGNLQVQGSSGDVVFEFYVDKDPPIVKLEVAGDQFSGKSKYISKRTQVKISADDEKSGVDKILYGFGQSPIDQEYKSPINIEKAGLNTLRVKSMDFVGNTSPILTNQFVCDNTPPVSSISIGSPKFESRDTLFISATTSIKINSSDDLSGIANTFYQVTNGPEVEYSKSFNIDNSGLQIITYYSKDNVSNLEDKKNLEVFVDNLPPVFHHHFSVEPIGNKEVRDENYTIYPSNVMLYIAATDASSGGERIEYKINDGPVLTANPIKGLKPGNYLIRVDAFDVLGNKSSVEIKFSIEQ